MEDTESVDPITPPAPEPAAPAPEIAPDPEALAALAEKAVAQRLPIAEEEQAVQLIRAALIAGSEDVAALLPKLGWAPSSRGVTAAWPELKATAKTAFLKTLAIDESEAGRRIRLSIARGLFRLSDIAACSKLIIGACKEIRDKKTGELAVRDAQNFAAVMIGKGKPWIAQIALADLKPADAALLVHCALIAAFSIGGPPVTPLGVLKWAAEAGQLAELHEAAVAAITKGVSRWSPKWADAVRNEVPGVPEVILAALKTAPPEPEPVVTPADGLPEELRSGESPAPDDGLPVELNEAAPADGESPRGRPVYVSKTIPQRDQRPPQQPREPREPQQREPQQREQQQRETQPQREPKGPPPKSPQFNPSEALRQLDAHIGWLRNELQFAEKKLRARDDDRRVVKRKPDVPVIEGEPTPEELARLNVQLEARIAELQSRLDDLTADAEARATSAGVFSGENPPPDVQLRTLLGLKLADAYADFSALEQEDRDIVIPQHFRTVLTEVFEVLRAEGVPLQPPPSA